MARALLLFLLVVCLAGRAAAQEPGGRAVMAGEEPLLGAGIPELGPPPELGELAGRPVRRVDVVVLGGRWVSAPRITSVRAGEALSLEVARRAMRELLGTGGFARAAVEARPDGDGVLLVLSVLPRRTIATIQLSGAVLDRADTLEAAGVSEGGEITAPRIPEVARKIRELYASHGFTAAEVAVDTADTDDPGKVVLSLEIAPGAPRTVSQRVFVIDPRADREVGDRKLAYRLGAGARVDEPAFAEADRELAEELRLAGFHRAEVKHAVRHVGQHSYLYVYVLPGPRLVPVFDGNRAFDDDDLRAALAAAKPDQWKPQELASRLTAFYVDRGFLDAEVSAVERGADDAPVHWLAFSIRENQQARVVRRVFPCLQGAFTPDQVGEEIGTFLDEELPSNGVSLPDPRAVGDVFGPTAGSGGRARTITLDPSVTYAPETYDRALKHLVDLFESKGYLNAVVGPVSVIRARCAKRSPPGKCVPEPFPEALAARCKRDGVGLPVPEPEVSDSFTCRPDPAKRIECSPEVTLRIPIHLGPQTTLYDLGFEGNRSFPEAVLARTAGLPLGSALSNVELEAARLRVLDHYKNAGYAYAEVRTAIETSPDRTRARVRFAVTEREMVTVTGFVVTGNLRTDEAMILRRVSLRKDRPYRQDLVRTSEERIATLGPFSSVTIGLEDPDVPQRNKRVVITVAETLPQYLDPLIGFSTGEGLRFGFEYGHKNIGGLAVSFILRVQLGYLFDFMIPDADVRESYAALRSTERLERRNSATLSFPEIGLGPVFSLALDGLDLNDVQRDYRVEKQTLAPTFKIQPRRQIVTTIGGSVEYNDVEILRRKDRGQGELPAEIRVPDGCTFVIAERAGVSWDRRDAQLAATRGTFMAFTTEHVNAFPVTPCRTDDKYDVVERYSTISHFLKLTGRVAGYIRLTRKGTALAVSLSGGYNLQLRSDSETYPDRLFFLGGFDSIRAFLSDSLVPEDVAQQVLDGTISIDQVRVRGGDFSLNPRVEMRIPLNDTIGFGLFLDGGNLWLDPSEVDLLALRIGPGAGLRIATPIGPIALDYGFNVVRRFWEEDPGALHFSIGLF